MRNIWFVSDTHFGHKNILNHANRPFITVDEMNHVLVNNWNNCVSKNDIVWHLGDFSFQNKIQFDDLLSNLNGEIHVVLGNHDKTISQNKRFFLESGKLRSVQNYAELKIDNNFFVLNHYGQRVWNRHHYGSIHLYGHSHGSLPPVGLSVDVGVDCKEITEEYRPISLDEVLSYMKNKTSHVADYHGSSLDKTIH